MTKDVESMSLVIYKRHRQFSVNKYILFSVCKYDSIDLIIRMELNVCKYDNKKWLFIYLRTDCRFIMYIQ